MSVRKSERSDGTFQCINKAKILSEYTVKICSNSKVFPKSMRFTLTNKMIELAVDSQMCIAKANATPLTDTFASRRRMLQADALMNLEALYTMIQLAYDLNIGLSANRVEFWGRLIKETIDCTRKWIKSDKERLKK